MNRREFVKKGLLGGAALVCGHAIANDAPLKNADSELKAATTFLAEQLSLYKDNTGKFGWAPDFAKYIRFFTTYAVPDKLRTDLENSLQFVLNSTASVKSTTLIHKAKRVPDSDTLWWIDIRDFGWDVAQMEVMSQLEPYFSEPLVDHRIYNYGRLIAGNIIFRADWFVVHATDVTKQLDKDEKNLLYYILLYGVGKEPKNLKDFQDAWRVDIKSIRVEQVEKGTIVNAGDSGVSRHTRQIRRARTLFGYYYETRDVKSHDFAKLIKTKPRDFAEDIFAETFDAGEYITSHKNGLQVYLLTNGNNNKDPKENLKRVDFGDPTVVVDKSDPEDMRVRTGKSCFNCHMLGINPATNLVRDFFQAGGDIYARKDEIKQAIEAFYLDERFDSEIEEDNLLFARAVKACNGLDPLANGQAYTRVYDWYVSRMNIEQCAHEWGLSVAEFKKEIRPTPFARLAMLYQNNIPIPRDVWDSVNAGGYIQAGTLIKRIRVQVTEEKTVEKIEAIKKEVTSATTTISTEGFVTQQTAMVDKNNQVTVYLSSGFKIQILRSHDQNWYFAKAGEYSGYVQKSHVRLGK